MTQRRSHGPAPSARRIALPVLRSARGFALAMLITLTSLAGAMPASAQSTPTVGTPVAATPSATMPKLTLSLKELNDSGIKGSVNLYDNGGQTIVQFDVQGAGGDHPARIYLGTCDAFKPNAAFALTPVDKNGKSTSGIATKLSDLTATPHAIVLHMAPKNLGTIIACADITGEATAQAATPAVATPTATSAATAAATAKATSTATPTTAAKSATPTTSASTQSSSSKVTPTAPATAAATASSTAASTATPTTAAADGTGGAQAVSMKVELPALNDSGVDGTIALTEVGSKTNVTVSVSPKNLSDEAVVHLHTGTCDAPGEDTIDLTPTDPNGVSTTLVDMPLASLADGNHMVNIHPDQENWDSWAACADIPARTTSVGGNSASATPTASSTNNSSQRAAVATNTPASSATQSGSNSQSSSTVASSGAANANSSASSSGTSASSTTGTSDAGTYVAPGDGTTGADANAAYDGLPAEAGVGTSLKWPDSGYAAMAQRALLGAAICLTGGLLLRWMAHRRIDPSSR